MYTLFRRIALVFIVFLSTFSGCSIGYSIAGWGTSRSDVKWEPLGLPPERAVRIAAADVDFVFVESVTGKMYYCDPNEEQFNWVESSPTSVYTRDSPFVDETPIPDPSGKVIDRADVRRIWSELIWDAKYAVTDDGKVWMWRYTPELFPGRKGIIPGSIIGFLIGILISAVIWKSKQHVK